MTLQDKLSALKISGTITNIEDNGFYSLYHVCFSPDVTINKIKARLGDLEMFFGNPVEMEVGRGEVILKVVKESRAALGVYEFTNDISEGIKGQEIPLIIGQTETGNRLYYDLTKMPHLLVSGSTGSGKSVFMHNCILSTFYTGNTNLMLIDVKRVEFSMYENLPHLITPVIYDSSTALKSLKNLCHEMDHRYEVLKVNGCRNIQEYRIKGYKMNYISVFIDELADLMMSNKRIEETIVRLSQLGRAAGIHLIVATQRPDSVVLSGLIRTNIPSRVCFSVQKATDSRIVLDMSGGEKLKGRGDGLFLPIGNRTPIRFQAPYISTEGLEKAIDLARHVND